MTLTAQQLELRRQGITSSDIPALLGFDPFGRGPFQVWLEKVHPEPEKPAEDEKPELEIGQRLEPFVAHWCGDLYEQLFKADGTHRREWMVATPDYRNEKDEPWEIKAWLRDPGDYVEAQVRWQLAVLDKPRGHVGWWRRNGFDPPEHRVIERNLEIERIMIDEAKAFWFDYVVTGKEPPVDSSKACGQYYARQKAKDKTLVVDASHPITEALAKYKMSKDRMKALEKEDTEIANQVKRMIYELEKVETPIGSMSYPWHAGKTITDWETVARLLASWLTTFKRPGEETVDQKFNALVAANTKTAPSYRALHPRWT